MQQPQSCNKWNVKTKTVESYLKEKDLTTNFVTPVFRYQYLVSYVICATNHFNQKKIIMFHVDVVMKNILIKTAEVKDSKVVPKTIVPTERIEEMI